MQTIDKRWDGLTIEGELPIGIFYAGARHKYFVLRIPMAGDMIAVQEEHPNASLHTATLAGYRRQILALGDIPTEAITFDLLRDELADTDLAALADADERLEKRIEAAADAVKNN